MIELEEISQLLNTYVLGTDFITSILTCIFNFFVINLISVKSAAPIPPLDLLLNYGGLKGCHGVRKCGNGF